MKRGSGRDGGQESGGEGEDRGERGRRYSGATSFSGRGEDFSGPLILGVQRLF